MTFIDRHLLTHELPTAWLRRCAMLVLLLLLSHAQAASFLDHWRAVCDDFREHYSYTEYKGLDWNAIFEANRARFEGELTPAQFATNLNESLLVLHDAHVAVQKPDGGWLGYSPPLPRNHPAQVVTNHAAVPYADYQGVGAIAGARLTNGVVHIIVPTLDTATWDQISDAELLSLFQPLEDATGVILDLRYNGGGNELHARRLASFFVREPTLYGYTRTRAPSEPGGFTPLTARHVTPHAQLHLDCPVVVLIGQRCLSSCEWLTLMLREVPNAILMGDRTRGGTANPAPITIAELGVSYLRSRWIGYTPEQEVIEDRGIPPTVGLRPAWSYDDVARHDFLLEHAIGYLEWRQQTGRADLPMNWRTDADADGASDAAEFTAATDPFDAASSLRLDIAGPALTLSWTPASRRAFVIHESPSPSGPWTEHPVSPLYFPQATWQVVPPSTPRFFRLSVELAP